MEAAHPFYVTREFWVAIAFVIFVVAVFRPIRKGLIAALDARAARIKAEIEEATKLREEAKALLATYQRKQRDAVKDATDLVSHAKAEAESARRKAAQELAATLARREQMAMDRIAQAESQALQQVRNAAVDVAAAATKRLMAEHIDGKKAETLIDQALAELPAKFH